MNENPKPSFSLEIFDTDQGELVIGDRDGDQVCLNPMEIEFLRGYLNDRRARTVPALSLPKFNGANSHIP